LTWRPGSEGVPVALRRFGPRFDHGGKSDSLNREGWRGPGLSLALGGPRGHVRAVCRASRLPYWLPVLRRLLMPIHLSYNLLLPGRPELVIIV